MIRTARSSTRRPDGCVGVPPKVVPVGPRKSANRAEKGFARRCALAAAGGGRRAHIGGRGGGGGGRPAYIGGRGGLLGPMPSEGGTGGAAPKVAPGGGAMGRMPLD